MAEILILSITRRCKDPAGHPAGDGASAFGARQFRLVDSLGACLIQALKLRDAHVQAGREPDDGKIGQPAYDVITQPPSVPAAWAPVRGGDGVIVDDREFAGVRGVGDRQSQFRGAANGVGDEGERKLHCRVLVWLR